MDANTVIPFHEFLSRSLVHAPSGESTFFVHAITRNAASRYFDYPLACAIYNNG